MRFGQQLPVARDDAGNTTRFGPAGSILEHVNVQDTDAVGVIAVILHLARHAQDFNAVVGLDNLAASYPNSVRAAEDIIQLWNILDAVAGEADKWVFPTASELLGAAMDDPSITSEYLLFRNSSRFVGRGGPDPNPSSYTPASWQRVRLTYPARTTDSQTSPMENTIDLTGADALPEVILDEPLDDQDLIFKKMKVPVGFASNKPAQKAPKGDRWEFVPGTDISGAVLGKPDPTKFFLIRQLESNPTIQDRRDYPKWQNFDWYDHDEVKALNKARTQIRLRSTGAIAKWHPPWTQMEKDELTRIIKEVLASGVGAGEINWTDVSQEMSRAFDGVTQYEGEPLAQTSKYEKTGVLKERLKFPKKLLITREGPVLRGGPAMAKQAHKYADIHLMLSGGKRKRSRRDENDKRFKYANPEEEEVSGSSEEVDILNSDDQSEDETPVKKQKVEVKPKG